MKTILRFLVSEIWSILYLKYLENLPQKKWPEIAIFFATKYAQFSQNGSVPTKDMQQPTPPSLRYGKIFMRDVECAE